jgi:hypothetical protein
MTLFTSRTASRLALAAKASPTARLPASATTAAAAAASCHQPAIRYLSSSNNETLTRDDVMDSNGLLQFTTLHEMNRNAAIAFKDNPLFGTYKPAAVEENVVQDKPEAKGSFEWMTYGEYAELVDRCRTVLKDVGECLLIISSSLDTCAKFADFCPSF